MTNLSLKIDNWRLNIHVAGIVRTSNRILICKTYEDFWFLAGGCVKAGENSLVALDRELWEELGAEFEISSLVVGSENLYSQDEENFPEYSFYYEVESLGREGSSFKSPNGEIFRWVYTQELEQIRLLPAFIKEYRPNGNRRRAFHESACEHVVNDEVDAFYASSS